MSTSDNNKNADIFKEIGAFTTLKNPNNFDDYFAMVLPTLSN
jgi:hypothetical protein